VRPRAQGRGGRGGGVRRAPACRSTPTTPHLGFNPLPHSPARRFRWKYKLAVLPGMCASVCSSMVRYKGGRTIKVHPPLYSYFGIYAR